MGVKANVVELKKYRERKKLSQSELAARTKSNVRTIERMEAGKPVSRDTIEFVAAELGVRPESIIEQAESAEHLISGSFELSLATSGRAISAELEKAIEVEISIEAEPQAENIDLLKAIVTCVEALQSPESKGTSPLEELDRASRLQAIADLNGAIREMQRKGLALYMGQYSVKRQEMYYDPELANWVSQSLASYAYYSKVTIVVSDVVDQVQSIRRYSSMLAKEIEAENKTDEDDIPF